MSDDNIETKLCKLLCHATGGFYSKSEYSINDMYEMVDEYIERIVERERASMLAELRAKLKDWREAYDEELFIPIKKDEVDVSRDRVAAQMGRHILDVLLRDFGGVDE
jgi:hypothetical protein